jgi:hypothetical protein
VYNKGQIYQDGDGEYIYLFSTKWKEYVWDNGAPIYDWAVYQRWWLWKIDDAGDLHWGVFDQSLELQKGWYFVPECPVKLDYGWYQ